MKDPKKAKWLVGSSAVLLSGLLLTQMNGTGALNTNNNNATTSQQTAVNQSNSANTEKELLQLDWTNFQVTKETSEQNSTQPTQAQPSQPTQSTNQGPDRMTQRS